MKKLLLVCLMFLSVTFVQAQSLSLGLKAGGNYAGFSGKDSEDADLSNIWGGHAGIFLNYGLSEDGFLSIQPELLVSMKGAKFELASMETETDLLYLDIPILANVKAGPLYFEVGPQASFLLSAKSETEGSGDGEEDIKDDLKSFSFGYAAGIGLMSESAALSIGARYNGDFSQIYDNEDDFDFRNSVFMVTIGYTLPLFK